MSLAQVGSTIGLGLLFDTLVVRSLMTPSVAALLGKWFWWPQNIRSRPVPRWVPAGAPALALPSISTDRRRSLIVAAPKSTEPPENPAAQWA